MFLQQKAMGTETAKTSIQADTRISPQSGEGDHHDCMFFAANGNGDSGHEDVDAANIQFCVLFTMKILLFQECS